MNQRLYAVVTGRVQGVGYRWFAVRAAERLGLTGWVRNLEDGGVELAAEGSRDRLEQLVDELRRGPRASQVEDVSSQWLEASGEFAGFQATG